MIRLHGNKIEDNSSPVAQGAGKFGQANGSNRPEIALARARIARGQLEECHFCAHHCAVNRLAGEFGLCHAGAEARFFSAQVEVSDELELIPTFAIALSGCDLRCDFCITGRWSWDSRAGAALDREAIVAAALRALDEGARTIMILGGEPTIHLPSVLGLVASLPAEARLVWKTNAHGSAHARELLAGMFDLWVADYKFGNDVCAQRLAKVPYYVRIVQENLAWTNVNCELIVRHLLMPGHIECCWRPVAEWLASDLPGVKVNLRSGFWPGWQSRRHAELGGPVSTLDYQKAHSIADDLGLTLVE